MAERYPDTAGWRAIPGYERYYEAHPSGLIRSLDRVALNCGHPHRLRGRVLSSPPASHGYPHVVLCVDGVQTTFTVPYLICLTFKGPRPPGLEVCHEDGNRLNSCEDNLYYGTSKQNTDDMIAHGTMMHGEKTPWAKLTTADVHHIRANPDGKQQVELARDFGVRPGQISRIVNRTRWKHV